MKRKLGLGPCVAPAGEMRAWSEKWEPLIIGWLAHFFSTKIAQGVENLRGDLRRLLQLSIEDFDVVGLGGNNSEANRNVLIKLIPKIHFPNQSQEQGKTSTIFYDAIADDKKFKGKIVETIDFKLPSRKLICPTYHLGKIYSDKKVNL